MSSTPRLSVVAPVAGLVVLALGAGLFFLTRGQESSQASGLTAQQLVARAAANRKAAPAPKKKTSHRTVTRKRAAPKPRPKAAPKRRPKVDPTLTKGLPSSVASAFSGRKVVVVALFAPDVPLDELAVAEARAGAATARAGFVALSVVDEAQARPLTKLLGVLESPSVLVLERPGTVFVKFSGYADQQTVAQAAGNAAL